MKIEVSIFQKKILKKLVLALFILALCPARVSAEDIADKMLGKVEKQPDSIKLRLLAGDALMQEERYLEAHEQYDAAAKLVDESPEKNKKYYFISWNNKGTALYKLGELTGEKEHFSQALQIFRKLLEIPEKKNDSLLHNNIAHAYHGLGKFDESKVWFEKALELNSSNRVAYSGYQVLLEDIEKQNALEKLVFESVVVSMSAAVGRNGADSESHLKLAGILLKLQRYEEAVEQYDIYLTRMDKNETPKQVIEDYLNALYFSGRYEDALEILQNRAESEPDNALVHARIGRIYFNIDKYDEAREKFDLALELDPENPVAMNGLQELEEKVLAEPE